MRYDDIVVDAETKDRFLLHSKLRCFKHLVSHTQEIVSDALAKMQNPYVAFSTGKDSTVVLDLVRSFVPSVPAVYIDADCAFPESLEFLETQRESGIQIIKYPCQPFLSILKEHGLSNPRIEDITLKKTVYDPIKEYLSLYQFDGVFIGLRTEESAGRRILRASRGITFFSKQHQLWECQPVADWSFDDIWAYIFSRGVPYNAYYDLVRDIPEHEQRLSYWAGESSRSAGRWVRLQRTHPDLFNQFMIEFPEVRNYL